MNTLLLESNKVFGEALSYWLTAHQHVVDWVSDEKDMKRQSAHNLIVAEESFFKRYKTKETLLKDLKLEQNIPLIVLLEDNKTTQKIAMFDAGVDCCLIKNEVTIDIHIRAKKLIQTSLISKQQLDNKLVKNNMALDFDSLTLEKDDVCINLSLSELNILKKLMEAEGKVVSFSALNRSASKVNASWSNNNLRVFIHKIRKKIGKSFISTVREVGYVAQRSSF